MTAVATIGTATVEHRPDGMLTIRLAGPWHLRGRLPSLPKLEHELDALKGSGTVGFDTSELTEWDSGLLTAVVYVLESCSQRRIAVDRSGLPEGVKRLLALSEAVPEKTDARTSELELPFLNRVGSIYLAAHDSVAEMLDFLGAVTLVLGKFMVGKARYRKSDLLLLIQQAGLEALMIVSVVSFLLGLILAFVGAIQLQAFGATIYVANLVGVAMVRDMGALMTGIIMAGRTGAAYAAQLGSMKVTQEIDALATAGVSPLEFLVLPRVIALVLMMPLLTIYSNVVGIVGGAIVGVTMLELSPLTYYQQTVSALSVSALLGGIFKGSVYGALVAIAGCMRGMQSGKSASSVGDAATSAVVTAIVAIIAACGLFSVVFYVLGL
ncbi:MAG: ABC transporter permease [Gemmatimonadota bacterium]|nr:MAG: ABC transporter permease [Gemmatimonadota bacterium]